jgi:hypothetical protein
VRLGHLAALDEDRPARRAGGGVEDGGGVSGVRA